MPSGPQVSELLALRMALYSTLGAKSTLVEEYWGLFAGKKNNYRRWGSKYRTEISIKSIYLIIIFSQHLTIHT